MHFLSFVSVFGYNKQHRDASIEADLNKLYDTRPTSGSLVNLDAFSAAISKTQSSDQQNLDKSSAAKAVTTKKTDDQIPYFDLNHSGNVTAVLGKTALLNCRVKNIGNKTVRSLKKKYIPISKEIIPKFLCW